jgi:ferric-dicitrate binding protein FerR (iron transport regulator)
MAAKHKLSKAGEAARSAQQSQYIQRLVEDEDLRSNLLSAYAAARSAFGRMSNGKPATQALFEDRKLQEELSNAANALRQAGSSLREPPKPVRRRRRTGRSLLLLAIGSGLALAFSEGLRSKLLDLLFGAEEEFDYSPTTAPETPAPAGVAGS